MTETPRSEADRAAYRARLRSIGYLSRGRTRDRSKSGRAHPDSGLPYKTVKDENGNYVTEHGPAGSGVSERQDVDIHPDPIHYDLREHR